MSTTSPSTFYSEKYDRTNFLTSYNYTAGKGKNALSIPLVDRLDNKYIDLINSCTSFQQYTVVSGDNLPNISYLFYKTTTLWWVIARVNGIVDPMCIEGGDVLLIPDINQINKKIGNTNTSNIGKVVIF